VHSNVQGSDWAPGFWCSALFWACVRRCDWISAFRDNFSIVTNIFQLLKCQTRFWGVRRSNWTKLLNLAGRHAKFWDDSHFQRFVLSIVELLEIDGDFVPEGDRHRWWRYVFFRLDDSWFGWNLYTHFGKVFPINPHRTHCKILTPICKNCIFPRYQQPPPKITANPYIVPPLFQ
jgi:hypothetical protein